MRTTHKRRTWIMLIGLVLLVSAATMAATLNNKEKVDFPKNEKETVTIGTWESEPRHIEDAEEEDYMPLEAWMGDPNYLDDVICHEEELVLEQWMTDPNYLDEAVAEIEIENEDELQLEDWMTDPTYMDE